MDALERSTHVLAHLNASTRGFERSALGGGVVGQCAPSIQNNSVVFGIDGLWLAGEPMLYGAGGKALGAWVNALEHRYRAETCTCLFRQEKGSHVRSKFTAIFVAPFHAIGKEYHNRVRNSSGTFC